MINARGERQTELVLKRERGGTAAFYVGRVLRDRVPSLTPSLPPTQGFEEIKKEVVSRGPFRPTGIGRKKKRKNNDS